MKIRIKNLRLRCVIGLNEWERGVEQDVVINVTMKLADERAARSDDIADSVDYKAVTKRIIDAVEGSSFNLIERLAGEIMDIVMSDRRVIKARVEVDKPTALRFSDSVSVELKAERDRR